MNEKTEMLHELCKVLSRELEAVNEKITRSGGMSAGDLDTVDKLSHALKSIKTTIAMMEAEGGYSGEYSGRYGMSYEGGNSNRGYDGRSYARGRNARRDSMGRYSRDGYSYADSMDELIEEMRGMMSDLPANKQREVQMFVEKMERM